jgi:hypothetical protein
MVAETGTYLYAVGRGLDPDQVRDVSALRGAALRVLEHQDLVAFVSTVDLDEFGESGLRNHLEDLDWLEDVARCHDEVVRRVAAATAALAPFRLATIYRSDPRVRDRIDELHSDLVLALDRIEGCSEWSVKALIKSETSSPKPDDARRPPHADADLGAGSSPGSGSGTAYLMRRRAELDQSKKTAENAAVLADRLFRELSAAARAARRLAPQDPRLSGRSELMALNSAFLVADARLAAFQVLVEDLSNRYDGFRVEVDGPWPPYSFATLERA